MSDQFLAEFERKRAERLAADRAFTLAGVTLTHKPSVAPEVGQRLEQMRRVVSGELEEMQKRIAAANGDGADLSDLRISDDEMIQSADETILACLEPESHQAWASLRAVDAGYPLNFNEIMGLADYLLGRVTGIPTDAPADSSAGRKTTGKPSKAASSSKANVPAGSH